MASIQKGIYRQFNGTDWDTIYLKTSADMVNQTNLRVFLNPNDMTINTKKLATVTQDATTKAYTVTSNAIILTSNDIPLPDNGYETNTSGDIVYNVTGALNNRIKIDGSTDTLTINSWLHLNTGNTGISYGGASNNPQYMNSATSFSKVDVTNGSTTFTLPYDDTTNHKAGNSYPLATQQWVSANYATTGSVTSLGNNIANTLTTNYLTKSDAASTYATIADMDLKAPQSALTSLAQRVITDEERQRLQNMWAVWSNDGEDDTLINKVNEVLEAFENFPESDNLFDVLSEKIDVNGSTDTLTINSWLHLNTGNTGISYGGASNNPQYMNSATSFSKVDVTNGSTTFTLPYDDTTNHKAGNSYPLATQQWVSANYATTGSVTSLGNNIANTLTNYLLKSGGEASNLTVTDVLNFGTDNSNQYYTNGQLFSKATGNGIASFKIPFDTHNANGTYTLATTTNLESYQRKITVSASQPANAISKSGDIWIEVVSTS